MNFAGAATCLVVIPECLGLVTMSIWLYWIFTTKPWDTMNERARKESKVWLVREKHDDKVDALKATSIEASIADGEAARETVIKAAAAAAGAQPVEPVEPQPLIAPVDVKQQQVQV